MSAHRVRLRILTVVLLGLALIFGCSKDNILGVSRQDESNGLNLSATPTHIVIDTRDPNTPTDPNHGNERYGQSVLLVVATDPDSSKPQPLLPITLTVSAGVLASQGTLTTDTTGKVTDTLRVFQSDPDTIHVTVSDGTRTTTIDVTKIVLGPPVANAGPDQVVQCGEEVTLDGSASTDPDNDIALYEWFEHFEQPEQVLLGTGESIEITLPAGEHVITLRVMDAVGDTSIDEVVVNVEDAEPPILNLSVSPSRLWPPNHKMVHVTVTPNVDECGSSTVTLESVTSNEPDNGQGDGNTSNDIQGVEEGTADFGFDLRAERSGGGSGRVYTILYRIVDEAGLETTATTRVVVPHDQGKK